jgi:GTPase SAR1 family protein
MIPSHSYRILIVGDAGVGKSSFSFLLCHDGEVLRKPLYTVGSDVEVLLHQAGDHASFFELIEVGGSPAFESSRHIWYSVGFDGIIGVCDVTNMNSRNNLDLWFREAVDLPGLDVLPWVSSKDATYLDLSLHPDKRLAGKRIPVLIVANKLDLLKAKVCF